MRAALKRIGHTCGIKIPKRLIAQCGLRDAVELCVTSGGLLIRPGRTPRDGWKQAFAAAGAEDSITPSESLPSNKFDADEWTW
jgi:antitoxin MazE